MLHNVNLHVYLNSFSFLSLYLFLSLVGDLPDGRWVASRIFLPLHYLFQILDKIRGMYSYVYIYTLYIRTCMYTGSALSRVRSVVGSNHTRGSSFFARTRSKPSSVSSPSTLRARQRQTAPTSFSPDPAAISGPDTPYETDPEAHVCTHTLQGRER